MSSPKGKTADELRDMGYGVEQALADGYKINEDDDRFIVAYKGPWPETDEFLFLHRLRPATKRQRQQAVKAMLLDSLSERVLTFEPFESHGLTKEECAVVQDELGRQLYNWAVRITPENVGDWSDLDGS